MADLGKDDPTINGDDPLWRRIPPWHLVPDQNRRGVRISSAAFDDDDDGDPMSVVLGLDVINAGRNAASVLLGHPDFGLASISAADARRCNQGIVRDPRPEEPAHAKVVGTKTGGVKKQLSKAAHWIVAPPSQVILGLPRLPADLASSVSPATAYKLLLPPIQDGNN